VSHRRPARVVDGARFDLGRDSSADDASSRVALPSGAYDVARGEDSRRASTSSPRTSRTTPVVVARDIAASASASRVLGARRAKTRADTIRTHVHSGTGKTKTRSTFLENTPPFEGSALGTPVRARRSRREKMGYYDPEEAPVAGMPSGRNKVDRRQLPPQQHEFNQRMMRETGEESPKPFHFEHPKDVSKICVERDVFGRPVLSPKIKLSFNGEDGDTTPVKSPAVKNAELREVRGELDYRSRFW